MNRKSMLARRIHDGPPEPASCTYSSRTGTLDSIEQIVGARIRARRKALNRTQQWIAETMHNLGCRWTRRTVMHAENGTRSVTARELVALALCLATSPGELIDVLNHRTSDEASAVLD